MKVLKTVKMYVGGSFIRSESGATKPFYKKGSSEEYARVCVSSKKDFRNAVGAAKGGANSWSKKTEYNKSQILYRMAEMTQGNSESLVKELEDFQGLHKLEAKKEVQEAIDTFVYYAGWCDKYKQVAGTVNPVASSHSNTTTVTNMGVVALIDSKKFSLSKLVDNICSILVGGNSVIALVSEEGSPIVTLLGEIFATSDLPSGVVNLLSGGSDDLLEVIAQHMEVRAISFQDESEEGFFKVRENSIDNMKRIIPFQDSRKSLQLVLSYVEYKTVWNSIGGDNISKSSY
jgi:acyl-CoA reductase-like NAD-dependent aldehyde dehydrogenase